MSSTPPSGMRVPDAAVLNAPLILIAGPEDGRGLRKLIEDQGWRRSGTQLNVLDVEQFGHGNQSIEEVDAAIRRASVVVVRLSERYLNSKYAERELLALDERSRNSRLQILAIPLERCEWQRFDVLRRSQVWESRWPLFELPESQIEDELRRIVDRILQLTGLPLEDVQTLVTPRYNFSNGAAAVLVKAEELATQSARKAVNCSCLLFGLAELPEAPDSSSVFIKRALDVKEGYRASFELFMHDADGRTTGKPVDGLTGRFTSNTRAVFKSAEEIASAVSAGSKEIHTRHLVGALIGPKPQSNSAKKRLEKAGIELSGVVAKFLDFVKEAAPKDDPEKWRKLLFNSPESIPRPDSPSEELSSHLDDPKSPKDPASFSEKLPPAPVTAATSVGRQATRLSFAAWAGHQKYLTNWVSMVWRVVWPS